MNAAKRRCAKASGTAKSSPGSAADEPGSPDLDHSPPRPVRLTATGKVVAGLAVAMAASALASGLWLYLVAEKDRARRKLLEQEGVSTSAEVVELRRVGGNEARYLVVYRYSAEGRLHRRQANIRRSHWQRLRAGSSLAVRYLPAAPELSWLRGYEPRALPLWLVPAVPAGLLIVAGALVHVLRKQWRLASEGRAARARVTRTRRVYYGEGAQGYVVHYEFPILSGAIRTGRYGPERRAPSPGTALWVLYDRENPAHNSRWPLALVRTGR